MTGAGRLHARGDGVGEATSYALVAQRWALPGFAVRIPTIPPPAMPAQFEGGRGGSAVSAGAGQG